jgi:hypothetical protein
MSDREAHRRSLQSQEALRQQLLYRYPDAAARLGVSVKTVGRMADAGRLKKVQISERTVGVTVQSVEALAAGEAA